MSDMVTILAKLQELEKHLHTAVDVCDAWAKHNPGKTKPVVMYLRRDLTEQFQYAVMDARVMLEVEL